ncbi:MAG: Bbp19 family protein [Candidatus Heimdallarchaeaceae archaeon]
MNNKLKELKEQYKVLFSGEAGMKVMEDLEKIAWYNKPMRTMKMSNEDLAFREGKRSLLLYIKDRIK